MAFPASPSDNQVHKEGNRSYVYDSTLGTWDHISEMDNQSPRTGGEGAYPDSKRLLGNEYVRTSTHSPTTIVMTCGTGSTAISKGGGGNITMNMWHQGGTGVDTGGVGDIPIHGWQTNNGSNATETVLQWDYGVGVEKYMSEISWYEQDGAGNSTGVLVEASNDNFTTNNAISGNMGPIVNGSVKKYTSRTAGPYRYWRIRWLWSSGNMGHIKDLRIVERDELEIYKPMMGLHTPVSGTLLQTTTVGPFRLYQNISSSGAYDTAVDALGASGELRAICKGKNSKFIIHFGGNQMHTNPSTNGQNRGTVFYPHFYIGPVWRAPGLNALSNAKNQNSSAGKLGGMYSNARSNGSNWDENMGNWTFVHEPYNEIGDIIRYRMFYAKTADNGADGYFNHIGGLQNQGGSAPGGHWHGFLQEIAR